MEPDHRLLGYADLAARWGCKHRSLIQLYSVEPERLPDAILLPGVRGPRWRLSDIEAWESQHRLTPTPRQRPCGRPRITRRRRHP